MAKEDVKLEGNQTSEAAIKMDNKPQIVGEILPTHLPIIPVFRRPIFPGIVLPLQFENPEDVEKVVHAMEKGNGYIGLVLNRSRRCRG